MTPGGPGGIIEKGTTMSEPSMKLDAWEYQQLVLMVRSKQALGTYLSLDSKALAKLWAENLLQTPVDYTRGMPPQELQALLTKWGSTKKAAEYLGVSESFLNTHLDSKYPELRSPRNLPVATIVEEALRRYQSVRFAARILGVSEAAIRVVADQAGLDLSKIVRYDLSQHNNAKGRRAELAFMEARVKHGGTVVDMNQDGGSQHPFDVQDSVYGRINVKASARYKFKAKTRAAAPYYWKFSAAGADECDYFAWLFYDANMAFPLRTLMISSAQVKAMGTKTVQISGDRLGNLNLQGECILIE